MKGMIYIARTVYTLLKHKAPSHTDTATCKATHRKHELADLKRHAARLRIVPAPAPG